MGLLAATSPTPSSIGGIATSAIDTTGADLLILNVCYYNAVNSITAAHISDSAGNTWTKITEYISGNSDVIVLYYVLNPMTSASHTITITRANTYPGVTFAAYSGYDTYDSNENGYNGGGSGGTSVQPGSLTPSQNGCLIITSGQCRENSGGAIPGLAIDSSFTVASSNGGTDEIGYGSCLGYLEQGTAGAVNPQISASGSPGFIAAAIAAFRPTAGSGYTLTADAGSFTLTGQGATLQATRTLPVAAGSFTLTGQSAALKYGHVVTAAVGTFTLTGQAAGLSATRTVAAAAGSFTLSGQAATLTATRTMPASAGTFTLTGQDVGLVVPGKLTADAGAFTVSGQAATLRVGRMLASAAGSFTFTGQSAGLSCTRRITVSAGTFTLTGQTATLTYSGLIFDPLTFYLTSSRDTTFNLISRRG